MVLLSHKKKEKEKREKEREKTNKNTPYIGLQKLELLGKRN